MPKQTTAKRRHAALELGQVTLGAVAASPTKTKIDVIIGLLSKRKGATIADMMEATGWQAHSVRGAIAGAIKKQRGLTVESERAADGPRVYRLASEATA